MDASRRTLTLHGWGPVSPPEARAPQHRAFLMEHPASSGLSLEPEPCEQKSTSCSGPVATWAGGGPLRGDQATTRTLHRAKVDILSYNW